MSEPKSPHDSSADPHLDAGAVPRAASVPQSTKPQPSKMYRWVVLIWVSLAMFGNYYFYDALSPLADTLQRQLGFTDGQLGLLNSFYSIAPIATVLIGGIIIDR